MTRGRRTLRATASEKAMPRREARVVSPLGSTRRKLPREPHPDTDHSPRIPPEEKTRVGRTDTQTGMLPGVPGSTTCVQRFDDSRNSAIHITYRISLRSSSLREPRHPLLKVVHWFVCKGLRSPASGQNKSPLSLFRSIQRVSKNWKGIIVREHTQM